MRLPPAWFRAFLALTCFIGVLATYSTVSGVGPGSALLAIMASLKLLETRKRRDQYVLLFISIFLVMASLLRDQYLWSLPYLGLSVLIILTAWLRLSAGPRLRPRASFGDRRQVARLRRAAGDRHVDTVSATRLTVLGCANRYQSRHLWHDRHYESGRYQFAVNV